ncbi:thiol S-methyltransferase TMT1B-like [Ruditapes philippinarum]|uniref:thiol S-methyltransferase TMT1B-like n=1 Tax=Ruditapes philippinarum TaxID=129788 RepID=UPI00295BA489|nr:thiol S-methyltransferase TMT1B-like [Ruditapes philippinarum]
MEISEVGNALIVGGILIIFYWCYRSGLKFYILQIFYAWMIKKYEQLHLKAFAKEKDYFSQILESHKKKMNKDLTILDVGSGPAVNVDCLPRLSKLVCLDPNPFFEEHVKNKINSHTSLAEIHFVRGYAENVPFENETFDAVICTLIMCVVSDLGKSLDEIMRVLKPGGKLIFLEHDVSENDMWFSKVIRIMLVPFLWLLYSCHYNRKIDKHIQGAGFSDVDIQYVFVKSAPFTLRKCIVGEATK